MQNGLRNTTILLRLSLLLRWRKDLICNKFLVNETVSSPYLLQHIMQSVFPSWALSRTQNRSSLAFFSQPHCPLQSLSKNVYLFLCFYYSQKRIIIKKNKNLLRCFRCRFLFSMLKYRVCIQRMCVWVSLCGYVCVCSLSTCFLKLVYTYMCVGLAVMCMCALHLFVSLSLFLAYAARQIFIRPSLYPTLFTESVTKEV